MTIDGKPAVLFLCTHNAGRSQMAFGFFTHLAGDNAIAYSGGSEPAHRLNPAAVTVMAERGIDITGEQPKRWDTGTVAHCDVVVTMGCGDTCPFFPGIDYQDWPLDDPAGLTPDLVRPIRDQIEHRVRNLLTQLRIPIESNCVPSNDHTQLSDLMDVTPTPSIPVSTNTTGNAGPCR